MLATHDTAVTANVDPGLTKSARILVVDGKETARQALATMLGREGFLVETARDGANALEVASLFLPDVVLTDLELPDMNGIELCALLHARRPGLPVLVMTAFCEMPSNVGGLRDGATDGHTKPADASALLLSLRGSIAARATAEPRHEDLLSIVSHDLRTPLSVIQTAVPLLLESAADAEDQATIRRAAAMITRASTRMSRLVEDLLDHTRIETGKLQLDRAPFAIADVLADVADLRPLAVEKQIRLEILPARAIDTVFCDRARIDQVLFNLVSNAIKCSRPGTDITVSAERFDAGACFAVRDQGRGMSPATLSQIFERFWQPSGSAHSGLGLGLYIARGIAEAHGGSLRAESTLGQGSTFYCYIPDG